ncbi:MAG: glycosyltransferase, partial [Oscillospiraceae bacterium]|nr:glycosyltransferase [Oscillospiraceae bacterium]
MDKCRVCLFCQTWMSGGIESVIYNVLMHADMSRLDVDIVCEKLCDSVFTSPLQTLGVNFIELSGSTRNLPANSLMFRELLAKRKYDVVHLNIFQALSLSYAKLAHDAGVSKITAHSHNTMLRRTLTRPLKLCLHALGRRRYLEYAANRFACSAEAARFMFGERDFDFIPNGIDIGRFRYNPAERDRIRRELGVQDNIVIGNVGRLCYQKNQSFLLDAMAIIVKSRPDARLLLVGEGDDRDTLEEKAKALGISDSVIFYGTSNRVEELMCAMDVFAFPSIFEGLGIVAVEAQAAGLPVVCSDMIPSEARLTHLVSALPLDSAASWAERLIESASIPRSDTSAEVKAAGFDICDVAKL